jgi:hypothetical protein
MRPFPTLWSVRSEPEGSIKGSTRTRILEILQISSTEKAPLCGAFAEPSDGLEPSTPSLPWRISSAAAGSRDRLPALFSVGLCVFGALVDLFLEMPWAALRSPVPVPKTCPQAVRLLADAPW